MTFASLVTFLQERTALNILSEEVLAAIAPKLETKTVTAKQILITENTEVEGLYILQSGQIESESKSQKQTVSLLPGSALNLYALILDQVSQYTVTTITESKLLFMDTAQFQELCSQYPEIIQTFSQNLAEEVQELTEKLNFEQERQVILRPYLVSKAKRGIIGKSKYAVRLRSQIKEATNNRESVLIFGEPGLEKDNVATLIHFSSEYRREPIIKVDCAKVQTSGAELFGRTGGKPGLIEALGTGTLILNNIHLLPSEILPKIIYLLKKNKYFTISKNRKEQAEEKSVSARIIIISEQQIPELKFLVYTSVRVPPLRVRKEDIEELVYYYINLISRNQCISKSRITPEALRRLQAYDFPNNLRELENLVERAIVQLQSCNDITEEIIWPSQSKKKQFRLNLLNQYPNLRYFLRSPWWPDRINYGVTFIFFAFIVLILFLGPQNRQENFALNLFWAWWWPLVLIGFPFVGRLWCAVCPFMIYGEVTQKLSLWLFPRQLKKWPRQTAEKWGGWFLFALFTLILLWEELWNLENTAYLSACLLLLITAGAMIFSAIFERRFWCRYLCPIGGMNGMFAKLSLTELRAQQGTCSAECTTYQCYKGGAQKGEGMETNGCPLYSHPAQLEDNRDCVLCMTCLKACPHRSVEFNLRPPGIELWTTHTPRSYEVALLFLLLNVVFLHHLSEIENLLSLDWQLEQFTNHALVSIAVLSIPVALPWLSQILIGLSVATNNKFKHPKFQELAYGYLPLVLAGNLAHYLYLGLAEGGRILPVTMATFGLSSENVAIFVAHPAVISFLQGTTLILGIFSSMIVTQKIARQPFKFLLPQHLTIVIFGIIMWQIIVGV